VTAAQAHPLLRVPIGDLSDIQTFDDRAGLKYNPAQFVTLLHRYNVQQALIVVAVPDTAAIQSGVKGGTATPPPEKVTMMFYHASISQPTPRYIDSVVLSVEAGQDIYKRLADHVRAHAGTLLSRVPAPFSADVPVGTMPPPVTAPPLFSSPAVPVTRVALQTATVRVSFNTMRDWQVMRARLLAVPGIEGITIARLRSGEALIDLSHRFVASDLAAALQAVGFVVEPVVVTELLPAGVAPAMNISLAPTIDPETPTSSPF
jgi:hypothetical protein